MAESLSSLFVTEKNKLHSTTGWILLLEVVVDSTSSWRLADDVADFTWNGKLYESFPLRFGEIRSTSDGTLSGVTVSVSNVTKELAADAESLKLLDSKAWIRLVHRSSGAAADVLEFQMQVGQVALTLTEMELTLAHVDLMNKPFPLNSFSRNRCRWVYKSTNCGYTLSLASCDLTLDGSNGCRVHGTDEVNNGATKLHPQRFGGFPGIPKLHG